MRIADIGDEGVCGTATINGNAVRVYVDIVDDEVFIENAFSSADVIISVAC